MKKYLSILVLTVIIMPSVIFAVEGTCSWHGGVDCSVGPDWDGSAICMDGWTESSERYFEQKICVNTPMCTQYIWNQMSNTLERNEDKAKYNELISRINTLNLEYPLIEIKIQERYAGTGATTGGIAPIISSAQRVNRNSVATSTYEATILDNKLRSSQIKINQICINEGKKSQDSLTKAYSSNIIPTKQTNLDLTDNPYQNVRQKKIYKDVRQKYALNNELGCEKLGLFGEDLAMCNAFAEDNNKDSWLSIDRPEIKIVTTQSLLEERARQEALKKEKEMVQQISTKKTNTKPIIEVNSEAKMVKPLTKDKKTEPVFVRSTTTEAIDVNVQNISSTSEAKPENVDRKKSVFKRLSSWLGKLFND